MEYGFTYNGKHCTDMGCAYIPSATKRQVLPDFSVVSSDITGMDGGYYYGSHLKIRTFVLDCYFEDQKEEEVRRLAKWFDRNTAGELIFDARPHVTYHVRPTKPFEPELYEHVLEGNTFSTYSGTFSITFSAYDPFGYLAKTACTFDGDQVMMSYCGILHTSQMPDPPSANASSFQVYNCGTEPCGLNLTLRGSAPNGVTFRNLSNGTKCKLKTVPQAPAVLSVNADSCRVRYGYGDDISEPWLDTFEDAFEYHEDGYITLVPGDVIRDVDVSWSKGSNLIKVTSGTEVNDSLINRYIWIAGEWFQILDVLNDGSLVLSVTAAGTGSQANALIASMNEIEIVGEDAALTDIHASLAPRVQ